MEAQWPIGYGVGLRIKRSSVWIRPWPLRWVLGQGSLLPLSQGEAFTLASISYLAILVKYILAKKKKKKKKFDRLFRCFNPPVTPFDRNKGELFRRVQRFWQRKVWIDSAPFKREKLRCKFLARKSAKFFANTKVQIFGKEIAKLIANFSATKVTSLPSLSLSVSLCISLSLTECTSRTI